MSETLTREQIEELLSLMGHPETDGLHYAKFYREIMAHDATSRQQLAQKQQECDEHVENLSRCKGNELAEQLAQAQAEIEDWRKKKKGKP